MNRYLMILLVFATFGACKTTTISESVEAEEKIFSYSKSPCFGRCPTYGITLLNNGTLKYNGKAHAKKLGTYETQLSEADMKYVKNELKKIDMVALSKRPPDNVADGSSTHFVYEVPNPSLAVSWMGGLPTDLVEIINWLEKINREAQWTKISDPKNTGGYETSEISNQLLVQFKEGTNAEEWVKAYSGVGAKLKKEIDASKNMWLVSFDETLVGPYKFLRNVQGDPAVLSASQNKKLINR